MPLLRESFVTLGAERESLVVEIDPQHDGHLPVFVHVVASEIESGSEYGLHTHDCFWLQP